MAMSLLLRNAPKLCGANAMMKSMSLTPMKAYTTVLAAERQLLAKPLALVKTTSEITTPATRMYHQVNHTRMWSAERFVSAALLAAMPAAFLFPSNVLDGIMAVSVIIHTHWGIEAIITDYMRPSIVGEMLPKFAHGLLLLISVVSLGGLFYIIHNDVGIANGIKKFWAVKEKEPEPEPEPEPVKGKGKK